MRNIFNGFDLTQLIKFQNIFKDIAILSFMQNLNYDLLEPPDWFNPEYSLLLNLPVDGNYNKDFQKL